MLVLLILSSKLERDISEGDGSVDPCLRTNLFVLWLLLFDYWLCLDLMDSIYDNIPVILLCIWCWLVVVEEDISLVNWYNLDNSSCIFYWIFL